MRQLIFWLIALLLVYGGWQFLCALRTGFRRQAVSLGTKKTGAANLDDDLFNFDAPASAKNPGSGVTVAVYSHNQPDIATPEKEEETQFDSFAIELELQRLRLEISTLKEAVEAQQKEIESLRKHVKRPPSLQTEATALFSNQEPDMSPEYDEALALARRGIVADVIASRCGITRAEADLVASLAARRQQQREAAEGVAS